MVNSPSFATDATETIENTLASTSQDFDDLMGSLNVVDPEGGVTITITGAVSDDSRSDFTHRADGDYGQLFYHETEFTYEYAANDVAINARTTDEQDTFTITATDDTALSDMGTFIVLIDVI